MNRNINLKIPFFGQIDSLSKGTKEWERKICWLACIKMCIEYYNLKSPDFEELLKNKNHKYKFLNPNSWEEKVYSYYIKWTWWLHYWLINIAKQYSLFWVRETINSKNIEENITKYLRNNICIIASVNQNFQNQINKWWHLVVIKWIGYSAKWILLIINDPIKNKWEYSINIETFINNFSGNLILISDKNNECFSSNSPIYIEQYPNKIAENTNQITYIHIHENEQIALKESKKFIKEKWTWKLLWIKQNWERFLRYEIRDSNNEKEFIRIDPNRIFNESELSKTILDRNSHLKPENLPNAMKIGLNIKNYILDKIDLKTETPYICIHTNKLLNINGFKWKCSELYINNDMPENAFIIASNKMDFELIKKMWINAIFYKNEDDWSLRDYLQNNWYRSFTIETWENDWTTFRLLLSSLYQVITLSNS